MPLSLGVSWVAPAEKEALWAGLAFAGFCVREVLWAEGVRSRLARHPPLEAVSHRLGRLRRCGCSGTQSCVDACRSAAPIS